MRNVKHRKPMSSPIYLLYVSALLGFFSLQVKAQSTDQIVLACVPAERIGCGCSIRLDGVTCSNQEFPTQPHLFTELEREAPLFLHVGGEEQILPHTRHDGAALKGDSPGRFTDTYQSSEFEVQVRYSPGKITCPKPKDEGCEYADVAAEVTIKLPSGRSFEYKGVGACGC